MSETSEQQKRDLHLTKDQELELIRVLLEEEKREMQEIEEEKQEKGMQEENVDDMEAIGIKNITLKF